MCVVDFDPPIFMVHEHRKAAKTHHCDECSTTIARGDLYEVTKAQWDKHGRPDTYKRCDLCQQIAKATDDVECSWCYGSLLDDASTATNPFGEHQDSSPEAMGRLIGLLFRSRERRHAEIARSMDRNAA
jgi:hypothetical protein